MPRGKQKLLSSYTFQSGACNIVLSDSHFKLLLQQ